MNLIYSSHSRHKTRRLPSWKPRHRTKEATGGRNRSVATSQTRAEAPNAGARRRPGQYRLSVPPQVLTTSVLGSRVAPYLCRPHRPQSPPQGGPGPPPQHSAGGSGDTCERLGQPTGQTGAYLPNGHGWGLLDALH